MSRASSALVPKARPVYTAASMAADPLKAETTTAEVKSVGGHDVWVIEFDEPAALDYAYALLKRRGQRKGSSGTGRRRR
jgi:hypothetical protein